MIARKQIKKMFCDWLTISIIAGISLVTQEAKGETFVSFNGQFKIDLPEEWDRLDYRTVDYFLSQSSGDGELLNYEAVFSPRRKGLFYDREYLMLTVDTIGEFSRRQIDSALSDMAEAFDLPLERQPIRDLSIDISPGKFVYDDEQQMAAIATEVFDAGKVYKISLLVVKFYESGTANFYFFAPDTAYGLVAGTFAQIVNSFSTENLNAVTNQPVKVADVKPPQKDKSKFLFGIPAAAVLVVLVLLIARRRKKRAGQSA